jgi:two-component system, chemotaxis family, chemotaxis protein CheY
VTPLFTNGRWISRMSDAPKKRVLVVDDAGLVRLYYRGILEGAGYQVDESLNGLEAIEKLLQQPADFLIVDVNMPQMDGLSFLRLLRRQSLPLSSTPALIASSEAGEQDKAAARTAGANYYLVKPLRAEVLLECAALLCGRPL